MSNAANIFSWLLVAVFVFAVPALAALFVSEVRMDMEKSARRARTVK